MNLTKDQMIVELTPCMTSRCHHTRAAHYNPGDACCFCLCTKYEADESVQEMLKPEPIIMTAIGKDLDEYVSVIEMRREPGESDKHLRTRALHKLLLLPYNLEDFSFPCSEVSLL